MLHSQRIQIQSVLAHILDKFKNNGQESSITKMIQCLGWRSLLQRHADGQLILLYKMINGHVVVDNTSYLIPIIRHSRHIHSASYLVPYEQKKYI